MFMNIKILVAAHKKYWMPEESVYLPLHVGAEGKPDLGAYVQFVRHAAGIDFMAIMGKISFKGYRRCKKRNKYSGFQHG